MKMSYDKRFTQKDYATLVEALDSALQVFKDQGQSDDDAEDSLDDFVRNHYFKVWRAMAPAS
jgi:hypothetical protein